MTLMQVCLAPVLTRASRQGTCFQLHSGWPLCTVPENHVCTQLGSVIKQCAPVQLSDERMHHAQGAGDNAVLGKLLCASGIAVADIGCGYGVALATMAEAFPNSNFTGFDICTHALAATHERIADLPNACAKDPSKPGEELGKQRFDFMMTLDAIHDMA